MFETAQDALLLVGAAAADLERCMGLFSRPAPAQLDIPLEHFRDADIRSWAETVRRAARVHGGKEGIPSKVSEFLVEILNGGVSGDACSCIGVVVPLLLINVRCNRWL